MFAVKINDPWMEERLTRMAREQKKSRPTIARQMLAKQLEDAEDYAAAVAADERLASGECVARPISELWRELGLDD
jgi:predicted DNA-binding protein